MLHYRRDGYEKGDQTERQTTGYQVLQSNQPPLPPLPHKLCGIFGSSGHDFAIIVSRARGAPV